VELLYYLDASLPDYLMGDGLRLRQILLNLVGNAIKFTQEGEITIRVEKCHQQSPAAAETGFSLLFSVSDTGIGIPAEKQASLFEAFTQVDASTSRKYGGTGLGLTISSRLAKLMGGVIEVESTLGEGTTFSFSIQTSVAPDSPDRSGLERETPQLQGKKILLIDAHSAHAAMIHQQLTSWGVEVHLANSCESALASLAIDARYDLMICNLSATDVVGVELAEQMLTQYPELIGLQLSPLGSVKFFQSTNLFREVVAKPYRRKYLLDTLHRILSKTEAGSTEGEKAAVHDPKEGELPIRILLAEDNLVNQKLALRVLEKVGYQADLANNGAEALEMMAQNRYDLILMDVQMPEMDGLEATRRIRANPLLPQPIIIAVTANAMQGDREMCLAAGMDDYLTKPFKQESLKAMVAHYQQRIRKHSDPSYSVEETGN
jgi:CheY-like chemotaxis protein